MPRRAPSPLVALFCLALALVAAPTTFADEPEKVDFEKQIYPLFARSCHSCHDAKKKTSGYRLDSRVAALGEGEIGRPIVPGNAAESPLVAYIAGDEPGLEMPPEGAPLSGEEIALIRRWIDEGAEWPDHVGVQEDDPRSWWAFRPLERPAVPAIDLAAYRVAGPIDAFVAARLIEHGLPQSPRATPRTLIRRLRFDLLGLPPTPAEIDRFLRECEAETGSRESVGDGAWASLVDRTLASPRYGERWGRHWLDVVHYGDSHGYDKDQPRPNAWPYRDWVVRAFDQDKPWRRFVEEQIAGDVLYPDTRDGVEGLGFLAAGPWDLISHAEVPETKIDGKIARHLDRDDMVATAVQSFASLTVQCAQCHDHKLDPITQEDYYSLQAVFAAIDRADKPYDLLPETAARRKRLLVEKSQGEAERQEIAVAVRQIAGPARLDELDAQIAAAKTGAGPGNPGAEFGWHSQIVDRNDQAKWVQIDLGAPVELADVSLFPCYDDFAGIGAGFGFPVGFKIEASDDPAFVAGVVTIADRTTADVPGQGTKPHRFDAAGVAARYVRVTATKLAPRQNDYIFSLAEFEALDASGKNVAAGATATSLDSIEAPPRWGKANLTDGIKPIEAAGMNPAELTAQRDRLLGEALASDEGLRVQSAEVEAELTKIEQELSSLPPQKIVYAGTVHHGSGAFRGTGPDGGKPRPIHVLRRGDVRQPAQEVGPGAAEAVSSLPSRFAIPADADEGIRRAALARWLSDPAQGIAWRSAANRIWGYRFGRALVDTPSDFGHGGSQPTHPELLDWLACELRDSQSVKNLQRQIALSETYLQESSPNLPSSEGAVDPAAVDAENRYLWRMSRRKLEAEALRDAMLAVAGTLDLQRGGPPFKEFVVEKPEHSPHYRYDLADPADPERHRRSIYRFLARSQPEPFMAALDCADPSIQTAKRNESVTPLQALALLNDGTTAVAAEAFAARLASAGGDLEAQVDRAALDALGREATGDERTALIAYAREHGLANLARLLFNLNEFAFAD
ncbi:MAG TPA: DUF1549 domain-containing protein [Pirellulaceae bacterium]|jgi:hypothetical protein|nr:DUF1549 domain-containing protein [Pirellulaceae bacterium]